MKDENQQCIGNQCWGAHKLLSHQLLSLAETQVTQKFNCVSVFKYVFGVGSQ